MQAEANQKIKNQAKSEGQRQRQRDDDVLAYDARAAWGVES